MLNIKIALIYAIAFFSLSRLAYAQDIRDIKPPIYFPHNPFFFIIAILILLIVASLLLYRLFKQNRLNKKKMKVLHKSAHEIAYEALNNLCSKNLISLGKTKEYYFELSLIVRQYIENRFIVKAPDMTTEEFLYSLNDSNFLSSGHRNLLKEFLTLCDIVKFAKYGPTQNETDRSSKVAESFIDETKSELTENKA